MYRKTTLRIIALLTMTFLVMGLLFGCAKTENTQSEAEKNKADASEASLPKITFSAPISEVDGVVYATRKATKISSGMFDPEERASAEEIPTCRFIPIETVENEIVSEFCEYGDYVYYVISGSGHESSIDSKLYRCNKDWTGSELIASGGPRDFVIDNGVIHFGGSAFSLSDLQKVDKEYPQYSFDGIPSESCYIQIFDDMIFYDDYSDIERNIYYYDGKTSKLIAENATLDGGYACGYLYFARSQADGPGAVLYRYNMETGNTEEVHTLELVAGGEGPYFCW